MKEFIIKAIQIILIIIFGIIESCVVLLNFFFIICALTEPFKFELNVLVDCMVVSFLFHILSIINSFIMVFFSRKAFKILILITAISYLSMTLITTVLFSSSPDFLGMLR